MTLRRCYHIWVRTNEGITEDGWCSFDGVEEHTVCNTYEEAVKLHREMSGRFSNSTYTIVTFLEMPDDAA